MRSRKPGAETFRGARRADAALRTDSATLRSTFAVVRRTPAIQRLLELTGADDQLGLVEQPGVLATPPSGSPPPTTQITPAGSDEHDTDPASRRALSSPTRHRPLSGEWRSAWGDGHRVPASAPPAHRPGQRVAHDGEHAALAHGHRGPHLPAARPALHGADDRARASRRARPSFSSPTGCRSERRRAATRCSRTRKTATCASRSRRE